MIVKRKIGDKEIAVIATKSKMHCPVCGEKEVYTETGTGDFYNGPKSFCKSCGHSFNLVNLKKDETIVFEGEKLG